MFALALMIQLKSQGMLNISTWMIVLLTVAGIIPFFGGWLGMLFLKIIKVFTGPTRWILIAIPGSIPIIAEITFIVLKVTGLFTISWLWIIPIIINDILLMLKATN